VKGGSGGNAAFIEDAIGTVSHEFQIDFFELPHFSVRKDDTLSTTGTRELAQTFGGGSCTKVANAILFQVHRCRLWPFYLESHSGDDCTLIRRLTTVARPFRFFAFTESGYVRTKVSSKLIDVLAVMNSMLLDLRTLRNAFLLSFRLFSQQAEGCTPQGRCWIPMHFLGTHH
jgi:hypothetical protein